MSKLNNYQKEWITQLHSTGEYSSRDIAEIVLGRCSRKSTVNDFLKSCNIIEDAQKNIWDEAPEWCNVIIKRDMETVYLSTADKGKSGKVLFYDHVSKEFNFSESGEFGKAHGWYLSCGEFATRPTVFDMALHSIYEEELGQCGKGGDESGETSLNIEVVDPITDRVLYSHYDSEMLPENEVFSTRQFALVVIGAYKALGFQNKMTIKFKGAMEDKKFVCNPQKDSV